MEGSMLWKIDVQNKITWNLKNILINVLYLCRKCVDR